MKKIFLSLALIVGFTIVNAQNTTKTDAPVQVEETNVTIDFESKVVDYGVIEHNSDGARKFVFTNNGTEPLLIKSAKGSCGCTVPTWKKADGSATWAPGESGEIGVKYATNRVGKFTKTITLTTNVSKKPVILTIKGEVNPPAKEASAPERKTEGSPLEKK
ncbi:MAG: DUF1573 domain-containing protein [Flavobacteriales bacterium]|jgi:hypothetical protein|nr:DUF1573 domain-containing protein [Flavobacteriales bacterium]MBT5750622.1 DUF1573 domain-containing protein [Flavobacteriales bacterium]